MGAGKDFFDALVIDYKDELPSTDTELQRRVLFGLKSAINGGRVVLAATPAGETAEVVAVSPEWETHFGYTAAELQALGIDFFEDESQSTAQKHIDNRLAAPYIAFCKRDGLTSKWQRIQGFNFVADSVEWRVVVFEDHD